MIRYKGHILRWIYPAVGMPFVAICDEFFNPICEAKSIASAKRLVNAFIITDEMEEANDSI